MADIFLSYAREDLEQARNITRSLEAEGWTVFWDRRIPPGRNFEEHLEQEIQGSRAVLVLWSPHSVTSVWVKIEAAHGRDSGILIPALIAPAKIPFGYGHIHAADLSSWRPGVRDTDFEELVRSIERVAPRIGSVKADGAQHAPMQTPVTDVGDSHDDDDQGKLPDAGEITNEDPITVEPPQRLSAPNQAGPNPSAYARD